ncbi:MAG: biotin transporter BioY [Clostridiales bacterium]|nr:biotin transporter BioY [Clostridiales bacterium]
MRLSTRRLSRAALMAALCAVLSQLSIPIGAVPVTLQTFVVALAGGALGAADGGLALVVYLLLGAVGLPVYAGFSGGVGALLGPTGGYLAAFPAMAFLCGLGAGRGVALHAALSLLGLLVVYAAGTARLAAVIGAPFIQAAQMGVLPFVVKDLASLALALAASYAVRPALTHLAARS